MDRQLCELVKLKAVGKIKANLSKHIAKYCWLPVYNYADPVWTKSDFLSQLQSVTKPVVWLKKKSNDLKVARKNLRRVLLDINDKKTRALARIVNKYIWLRTDRVDTWRKSMYLAQPFYREIERRANLPFGATIHLTITEIEKFLQTGAILASADLKARLKDRYILLIKRGTVNIITKKSEKDYIINKVLGLKSVLKINYLRGLTVCRGKVRGRVRLVMSADEVKYFKKNEILVSNMTHPDYFLAMKKARAIICDEGGVTCHAAIFAREFEIPCIISTKKGTKVLKDGDLVEVDADKGIVRKL